MSDRPARPRVARRTAATRELPRGRSRTLAAVGLAVSLLFAALVVVVVAGGGDGDPEDTEVLGVTSDAGEGEIEVASSEGDAFFTYRVDPRDEVAGSAAVVGPDDGVVLTVSGSAQGDRAVVRATVENATDGAIVFPDGLSVRVSVEHDGRAWRTLEVSDPAVTGLGAGERASVSTEVGLDEPGEYELAGEVRYRRR